MQSSKLNLAAYSTLAGTFLLCTKQADAQVIYHDLDPDMLIEVDEDNPGFETMELDINFDGINDFSGAVRFTGFCSGCSNTSSAYFKGIGANEVGGASVLYSIECSTYSTFILSDTIKIAQNIGLGHTIPDTLEYNEKPAFIFLEDGGYGYCHLENIGEEDRESIFLPIKLSLDGSLHYGWIRFRSERVVEDFNLFVRIYIEEYAYNSTPDAPVVTSKIPLAIQSNQAPLLEPKIYTGSNQLNIIPPAFAASQCTVSVFNLSGALVFSGKNESNYQIPLLEGAYIINLLWNDAAWSGKTVITF